MLHRQGKQKSRCRVLFSDLKVFLLRPPTPSAPPPAFTPMNGLNTEGNATSSAAGTNGSLANGHHQPAGRSAASPPPGEASEGRESEDWAPRSLDGCSSSEDCSKEKFDERLSLNSCTDSGVRTPLCRICFQGPEQGELLSPCRCSGSVRCTHEPCLIKWISERGSWSCELCYYKYQVIAISTKNPLQWQTISLTVIEKVQIAAAVLGSLFLIASISWLVWSSLSPSAKWQRQDLLFQICYAMYGFMDLVCIVCVSAKSKFWFLPAMFVRQTLDVSHTERGSERRPAERASESPNRLQDNAAAARPVYRGAARTLNLARPTERGREPVRRYDGPRRQPTLIHQEQHVGTAETTRAWLK
ncbi:hypothetical protein P4O66_004267 [Electrophorus voltai]|uniref:RING-type E3 ubiquitin transferase n=1 Tax=Electrophorus voltai TaxID=2609070 RepID=A0AAD9E354_9TELE|nr:hypothetical protein P4O66_004267 [Electrophorus voltai]